MTRNQGIGFGAAICVILLAGGSYFFVTQTPFPSGRSLAGKPSLQTNYQNFLADYKQEKSDPNNPEAYVKGGLELKTIADATGDTAWYKAALATYERGIKATDGHNTLLIANAAVIAEKLGDYESAKKYYETAIEVSPGDATFYVSLVRVMRLYLNATPNDILAIYNKGIDRVVGGAQIYADRAQYLKTIGRFDDAASDWKLLHDAKVITDVEYKTVSDELTAARAEANKK